MVFEAAELGRSISKREFESRLPDLRVGLLNAQFELRRSDVPVLVILGGIDFPGRNDLLRTLHQWMDARYIETHATGLMSDEERERPRLWRFWRRLPPRGRMAIFLLDWTVLLLQELKEESIDSAELDRRIAQIRRLERMLVADGTLILKFWLHLPRKEFEKRLKKGRKGGTAGTLEHAERRIYECYDEGLPYLETTVSETSLPESPWHVVESTDERYRDLTVAETILAGLQRALERPAAPPTEAPPSPVDAVADELGAPSVLDRVDLSKQLEKDDYQEKLERHQSRLGELVERARRRGIATVLVFEGWDAAGKGGAIRRITRALDARYCRVLPVAAPTDEERAQHYLWRFWRNVPRDGHMAIFDRSWYGRVLVERVEGFARPEEWSRAYDEINGFEEMLTEHGTVVLKFWIHIDPEEQLKRFEERELTPYKKHKLTDEDYRNREKWPEYERAVNDMVARTSTPNARWHVVAGNDKRWARVDVLRKVCRALEERLAEE